MNRQKFLTSYHKLPERLKALMRLKALLYFKTPVESLRVCFYELTYLFPAKTPLPILEFNDLTDQLKSQKLIDREGILPPALIHFLTVEALESEHAEQYLKAIEAGALKMKHRFYSSYSDREETINTFRLSLYTLQKDVYNNHIKKFSAPELHRLFQQFFLEEPLELSWLKTRFLEVQRAILHAKLTLFCLTGTLLDQMPALLGHYLPLRGQEDYRSFESTFLLYDVLSGNREKVLRTLETIQEETPLTLALRGDLAFLGANTDQDQNQALAYFESALKLLRKMTNKKKVSLDVQQTLFYVLALFQTGQRETYAKIQSVLEIAIATFRTDSLVFEELRKVLWKRQGLDSKIHQRSYFPVQRLDPFTSAVTALAAYWLDEKTVDLNRCREQFHLYQTLLPLVAKIFAEILYKLDTLYQKDYEAYLKTDRVKGLISFIDCVQMGEHWERVLHSLDHFFDSQGFDTSKPLKRLAWYFNPATKGVEVREQALQARGGWSSGKAVSLKRLYDRDPKLNYLTEADKKVIKTLTYERSGWSGQVYSWDSFKTPLALIGHPLVYHSGQEDLQLDLVASSPELLIKQKKSVDSDSTSGQFHLTLSHTSYMPTVFVEKETPSRYKIIEFSESLVSLMNILGTQGLKIPGTAKDHLVSLIQKASPLLPIHSEADIIDIPARDGDTLPRLQILPLKEGLKLSLWVRPFGDQGPYFRPGHGRTPLFLFLDGQQVKVNRSLKEEKKRAEELIQSCSSLQLREDGSDEWILEDPEDCLEVLSDLQELKDVTVEWPEGQKLFVTPSSSFEQLSLKILHHQDWFAVQGSLKVDEDTVMGFEKLLELLDQAQGRFIPLDGNRFIALSSHFKKQLQELKALSETTEKGCRVHSLGSLALKQFADKASHVEGDQKWKQKLKALNEAEAYQPKLPSTLQAELRDYQVEGFQWISRLAHLGVGACLADDMGLGKTLQALAVLLNHAPQGPCLVVAPTSVCHNWISEIEKFAPTLIPYTLPDSKRKERVEVLQAMDVLICSYSLLQQEEELLANKKWQVIVLDEAQAIKNSFTKRFQAAIKLQGAFKLALTGTPVENNLEEIWSLFRFITPGLLGSREGFQKRFLLPIEKDKDKARKNALKSLVQMFILRRTKNAVLQELPPQTEQTILVEMSSEELSFYEALRRQALTNISNLGEEKGQGQRKIHILAEITRLRRACCHPGLVDKEILLPSSKMKVFLDLVEELLENNHQALVFSQYVGYLALVRQKLDKKGISYQYLDGSTPAAQRKKQVQAFQEGNSSLFLLSLKAGGTGLNLTAADYVIHLDPWWNPAVEDQASDRAHRLGQKRPVTIYRLIVQHSIEEKILTLHKNKREMVDDLLEGSHNTEKMSEEDLLKLIALGS
jgi:superfamily II DNA or RNA helicase